MAGTCLLPIAQEVVVVDQAELDPLVEEEIRARVLARVGRALHQALPAARSLAQVAGVVVLYQQQRQPIRLLEAAAEVERLGCRRQQRVQRIQGRVAVAFTLVHPAQVAPALLS